MSWVVILVLAAVTVAVLALLLVPLLRRPPAEEGRDRHSLEVYRDQLDELERDVARGVMDDREAATARQEIERRILALNPEADSPDGGKTAKGARMTAVALVVVVPLAAAALYAWYGSPGMPDQPMAERWADDRPVFEGGPTFGDVRRMIARFEQTLAEQPHNAENWATLAGAYALLEQYGQAAEAMARAAALEPLNAERQSLLGEFLVLGSGGVVNDRAAEAFRAAIAADPFQPVARFYLALARAQDGDVAGAMADWQALLADTPPGAPWEPMVTEQITRAATELGIDPNEALAQGQPSGPSQEDVEAITSLPEDEQMAMIRGMVDGLAARLEDEPDNLEGWLRLAQSYAILGEWELSRSAYLHALKLAPNSTTVADGFANSVSGSLPQEGLMPEQAVEDFATVLSINPTNEQALYYSGVAATQAGDTARAITLWTTLRDQLDEGSRERQFIEQRLDEISG